MADLLKMIFEKFGAQMGFTAITVLALWWVGRRLFALYDGIAREGKEREDILRSTCHATMATVSESQREAATALAQTRKSNEQAHEYQREEHREMVTTLQAIQVNLAKMNGGE